MKPEPKATPSALARIPDLLKDELIDLQSSQKRRSMLISSNGLSNKFIYTRWSIRPSQRRKYRNLFSKIRERCRNYFRHLIRHPEIAWSKGSETFRFGAYLFDEVRGNIILGFVQLDDESPFATPSHLSGNKL